MHVDRNNDVAGICLYSGVNPETASSQPGVLEGRVNAVAAEALVAQNPNVSKWSEETLIEKVKNNREALSNPLCLTSGARKTIFEKLNASAESTKRKEDSLPLAGLCKFFMRIGGLFEGYGFHTKGEWAAQFAEKMRGVAFQELTKSVTKSLGEPEPKNKISEEMFRAINSLSETEFKELLESAVFWQKLGEKYNSLGTNLHDQCTSKVTFFTKLDSGKQQIFADKLFARSDWFGQLVNMSKGVPVGEFTQFVKALPQKQLSEKFLGLVSDDIQNKNKFSQDQGSDGKMVIGLCAKFALPYFIDTMIAREHEEYLPAIDHIFSRLLNDWGKQLLVTSLSEENRKFLCSNNNEIKELVEKPNTPKLSS